MKRVFILVVLLVLLASTVSAGAALAAVPKGKSSTYQFTVPGIDGSAKGEGSGKLIVDTKAGTYVFNGRNGVPGISYDLYYVIGTAKMKLATGAAVQHGIVVMSDRLPSGVDWTKVTGAVIKLTPTGLAVSITSPPAWVGPVESGTRLGLPQGTWVTFTASESGNWHVAGGASDSWTSGQSVNAYADPGFWTCVEFYKTGSSTSSDPDWYVYV